MLRTLVVAFVNFHFIDLIWLNLILAMLDFYIQYTYNSENLIIWLFFVLYAIGFPLACVSRWLQRPETHKGRTRFQQIGTIIPGRVNESWVWLLVVAISTMLCTAPYSLKVTNVGALGLQDPFSVGVFISVGLITLVLFILSGVAYGFELTEDSFAQEGMYRTCWIGVLGIAALDLVAFQGGWALVLITAGLMLVVNALKYIFINKILDVRVGPDPTPELY
jgi:hypothetical protein